MGKTVSRTIESSSIVATTDQKNMTHQDVILKTRASDLSSLASADKQEEAPLPSPPDVVDAIAGKVVIVSGGPLLMNDDVSVTKVDDGSSAPSTAEETAIVSLVSSPSTVVVSPKADAPIHVKPWCGTKLYSDLVQEGVAWLNDASKQEKKIVMVFESPSYETPGTSFVNGEQFFFHDSPAGNPIPRTTLGPLRYAAMTGNAFPIYLQNQPPAGLLKHWKQSLPKSYVEPTFVHGLEPTDRAYAYLPLEQVEHHVNDPAVHYHLAGKDAIPLMTNKTTKLLPDTKQVRPCIAKVNHSMGSRGIFVIRNDEDEQEFLEFLQETGNPPYVVSEFIDIVRNIACHFFIHPKGEITWLGSSENVRLADGTWSADSTMDQTQQDDLQALQVEGARDVAAYCLSLGYWGFCGIDVLIDSQGRGHVVDVNPRVTGTCPALMTFKGLQDEFGWQYGLFRRSTSHAYPGSAAELLAQVEAHNTKNAGKSRIVLFSLAESASDKTLLNIGVYGTSLTECEEHLNHFSRLFRHKRATHM